MSVPAQDDKREMYGAKSHAFLRQIFQEMQLKISESQRDKFINIQ